MMIIIYLIKRMLIFLLKVMYIGFFFVVGVWLLKMLYFPKIETEQPIEVAHYAFNEDMMSKSAKFGNIRSHNHFHITDEYVLRMPYDPPFCLRCHGIYPHMKNIKTMSLRNMHAGFMTCEVCHIRRESEEKGLLFKWVDLKTGKMSMHADGGYGKYSSHIVPVKNINGHPERMDRIIEKKFSEMYAALTDKKHTHQQQLDEVQKVHERNLSKKPVSCLECHKRRGYLDFASLGFPASRVNQLVSSEVSRMVGHYETFYIPKMLMPK